jgi:hypothetical protein
VALSDVEGCRITDGRIFGITQRLFLLKATARFNGTKSIKIIIYSCLKYT